MGGDADPASGRGARSALDYVTAYLAGTAATGADAM